MSRVIVWCEIGAAVLSCVATWWRNRRGRMRAPSTAHPAAQALDMRRCSLLAYGWTDDEILWDAELSEVDR